MSVKKYHLMESTVTMIHEPIRIAIVGCGAVTEKFHAPALRVAANYESIDIRFVVDPDSKRRDAINEFWPEAKSISSTDKIEDVLDLALIASPVAFHAVQAQEMLVRNCHVLCEKPMASTRSECEAMIATAQSAQRLLAIGHRRRFYPANQSIHEIVQTKMLGKAVSFSLIEGAKFEWPVRSDTIFRKETAGGGVLIDIGSHVLDLALWWFGEPNEVSFEDDAMGGLETNCKISLGYDTGLVGEVHLSRDGNLANRHLIRFENGWIRWDLNDPTSLDIGTGGEFGFRSTVHRQTVPVSDPILFRDGPDKRNSAFIFQILNVVRAIQGREQLLVPGKEAVKSIKLIEQCYENASLMDLPWMSAKEVESVKGLRCR